MLFVALPLITSPAASECKYVKALCKLYGEKLKHQIQIQGPNLDS